MTGEDRDRLLKFAGHCVERAVSGKPAPDLSTRSKDFEEPGAAFVTLRSQGDLRGCIGHTQAMEPLWKSVREMATAAATRDHRFTPLQPEEPFDVEISILSKMTPIQLEEIRIGTHGLYVRQGSTTGLLLPHVAEEYGWTAKKFLEQTFYKAGLPIDSLGDSSVEILGFTCERIP